MISWQSFLEDVIYGFKNTGHKFNYIEELNIITIAYKVDMSYDFYIKHNMHAVEWKLFAMIIKNENLIKKTPKFGDTLLIKNLGMFDFDFYELIVFLYI